VAIILIAATAALIGTAYWRASGGGAQLPTNPDFWIYGGALAGAGAVCAILAIAALRKQWGARSRQLVEQVQALVTNASADAPTVGDAKAQTALSELRSHMTGLRSKVDQLQMQRKNLEIQLRLGEAERRQSHAMISGISDAVLITDKFDELLMTNPSAAALFGFEAESAPRKPITKLIGETPLAHDIAEMRNSHGRGNRRTFETQVPDAANGGQVRSYLVTMTAVVSDAAGGGAEVSGVVTVLHDITRELEISRMKTDFVSHVSHELRTPLSSIKAYAELLVDGEAQDDKTRMEFYGVIQTEAERLGRLIDNILNISRIESGMIKVSKKPVALSGLLQQAIEVATPSAKEKSIALTGTIPPVFFQVEADKDMIYQAALNLISNAIKYTPNGGSVRVELIADEVEQTVTVKVTDTGVGIPPDAMKHLFTKFYRVEANKNMAKGSGLGLSLTKQIIEQVHKGKMLIESQVGKGSMFGFALPIAQ
jgi:two-component system phosphate regulon sensor histidine kinase PhoR